MSIKFRCRSCNAVCKATEDLAGERIECHACGKTIVVPEDDDNLPMHSRPIRRAMSGLTVGSLVVSLIGIFFGIGAAVPFACGMCCFFLIPLSWLSTALAALLNGIGLALGLTSRSRGDREPATTWAIALNAVGLMIVVLAIVLQLAIGTAGVALSATQEAREAEEKKAAEKKLKDDAARKREQDAKRVSLADLRAQLIGKSSNEVIDILGRPAETSGEHQTNGYWTYKDLAKHEVTGLPLRETRVHWRNGKVQLVTGHD